MNALRLLIISLVIFFLTLGISSADDLNGTDSINSQSDMGLFDELQDLIDNSPEKSTINLTKDYFSDNGDFPNGIEIAKPITINGNNHVIDANQNSRIFLISSKNVVLNNIKFINGKTDFEGGAIKSDYGGTINNCIFEDNYAKNEGGAIYQKNGNVHNSTFINNGVAQGEVSDSDGAISGYGGAIYQKNSNIHDSTFIGNVAFNGGAIEQDNSNVYNSIFIGNSAVDAGALKQYGSSNVYGSTFINNTALANGGAIWQMENSEVHNSNFINNSAFYGGAVNQDNSKVYKSNFENNYADYFGGAIYQEFDSRVYDSNFVNNTAGEHGGAVYQRCGSAVYNSTFENNHAGHGCDDVCGVNPQNNTQPDNITHSESADGHSNQNKIVSENIGDSTGNPIGLLILVLIPIIIRIKK